MMSLRRFAPLLALFSTLLLAGCADVPWSSNRVKDDDIVKEVERAAARLIK